MNKIKELRMEKGLSVPAISKETNISRATLYKMENCPNLQQSKFKYKNLERLANFYRITIKDLMGPAYSECKYLDDLDDTKGGKT